MSGHDDENSYGSVLRGMSAFAGVQVFLILAALIRGKFVAMFLGPAGMGVSAIFTNVSNTLSRASSLGLNLAIVREAADSRSNPEHLARVTSVTSAIVRLTALLGAAACALLCIPLSRLSFGTADYAWQFLLLSAAIYLTVEGNARLSVLQGLHETRRVAHASIVGAVTGLLVGVPLYWAFGSRGIVPAMVALQLALYIFYTVNLRKVVGPIAPCWQLRRHWPLVKRLMMLGIVLLSGDIIGAACEYGVNIFLRISGGTDTVGLYQAAHSLTKQYSGVVFAAMSLDYFPRLTARIARLDEVRAIVSRQLEVVALAITPIACWAIALAPTVIALLLTDSFDGIIPLLRIMSVGIAFRAISFPLGYVTFAKGDRRLYFWMEAVCLNLLYIGSIVVGWHLGSLTGIGWAFVIENAICLAVYVAVNHHCYRINPSRSAWRESLLAVVLVGAAFVGATAVPALMWGAAALSTLYSLQRLRHLLSR